MSQENLDLVRAILGPFEQGDIVPLFRDDTINASLRSRRASRSSRRTLSACLSERTYDGLSTSGSAWLLESLAGLAGAVGRATTPESRT